MLRLYTDDQPGDTSWKLTKGDQTVLSGPPPGEKYSSFTLYEVHTELVDPGTYVFTMYDFRFGQGTAVEEGYFELHLNGKTIYANYDFSSANTFTFVLPSLTL